MPQRIWSVFDTVLRIVKGTFLLVSAACVALGQNPVPLVNQPPVPDAAKPGGAAFSMTVNGSGFVAGSVVHWNGIARTTAFVSQFQLKAAIPAADIATAQTARVTVVNPGPGGGASNIVFFGITPPTTFVALGQSAYATADRSYGVAVGDFNRDGKPDLAVTNYASGTVSVLLGNGNGTFQGHVDYATGEYPEGVAVGDFNNDGNLDLVVGNDQSVSVLLGNGDGTFQAQVEYPTGIYPGVAVADFDRDGKLDLVVADHDNIKVFLGNGNGTFQPAVTYAAGTQPGFPAVGDFNRDGKLDLVVSNNTTNTINVLLGNGNGTFQPAVTYNTAPSPTQIAVADFNVDDKLDLAVGGGTGVSVLVGNGDGTFQAHVDYDTGSSNPCSVAAGDFNGDGHLDLAVADLFSTNFHLLLGNGNGTFGAPATYAAGSGTYSSSVAPGDFNGDGRLDIAAANSHTATVSVFLQPTVLLSKSGLAFGAQVTNTSSAAQNVTLTNLGPLVLTIDSLAVTGANANDFSQTDTCDSSVPAEGGTCTIAADFTPTVTGPLSAAITITDSAQGSPQTIPLTGIGVLSGVSLVQLSPNSLNFGYHPLRSIHTLSTTLTNVSLKTLSVMSIAITGTTGGFSQTNNCGTSVGPGGSCVITVRFEPTASGTDTATLSITDNGSGSPQSLPLSGGVCIPFLHRICN